MSDTSTPVADAMESTGLPRTGIATTLTALTTDHATLTTAGGHTITWPAEHLPAHAHIGSPVILFASQHSTIEEERNAIAKSLVNELLTPHDAKNTSH